MNRKYTVENDGKRAFFIIDKEKNLTEELEKVFSIEKGYGLTADEERGHIVVKNYFRADTLASFPIFSVEDTEEETVYRLVNMP